MLKHNFSAALLPFVLEFQPYFFATTVATSSLSLSFFKTVSSFGQVWVHSIHYIWYTVHFGSSQKWDSGVSVLLQFLLCLLWMASQHIVGVHVAMFTDAEVLSSAAFLEFRRQVDALLARGDRAGALRL